MSKSTPHDTLRRSAKGSRRAFSRRDIMVISPLELNLEQRKFRIQTVEGFVAEHFQGDLHAFRKHYGLVMQKIKSWIASRALISEHAIYLRKSKFNRAFERDFDSTMCRTGVIFAPLFADHLQQRYRGNMTAFAEDKGTRQQQVSRWVHDTVCLYAFNEVYRRQVSLAAHEDKTGI